MDFLGGTVHSGGCWRYQFSGCNKRDFYFCRFFPAFLQVSIFDKCATEEQKEADNSVGSFGSSWMEALSSCGWNSCGVKIIGSWGTK